MQVKIKGKNLEVSDALKDYAEKKLQKVGRFFTRKPVESDVTFNIERGMHIVDITLAVGGLLLRGESKSEDMYHSIDMAVERIERQIEKYKARITRKLKNTEGGTEPEPPGRRDEERPRIVRSKKFDIKPMDVGEAVMQMDLLGHDFYVFTNSETDEINVIYKRKDGQYGLIEPEK
ncbi:MAG: ribosome hibernation-promoting factor, HPF/YfiA family [Bacillota bacterium]